MCEQNPPASLKRKTSYCIASPLIAAQVFQLVLHVLLKLLRQQHSTLHRIVDVEPVIFLLRTLFQLELFALKLGAEQKDYWLYICNTMKSGMLLTKQLEKHVQYKLENLGRYER